jgi:hypothetical protein
VSFNQVLRNMGLRQEDVQAFADWPALKQVASRYVYYVSPWLMVGNENFAERELRQAIRSYDNVKVLGSEHGYCAFVGQLIESARRLAALRVSVQDNENLWRQWFYDEPLTRYMAGHKRASIQIRKREAAIPHRPVAIKMCASIMKTKEIVILDTEINRILS